MRYYLILNNTFVVGKYILTTMKNQEFGKTSIVSNNKAKFELSFAVSDGVVRDRLGSILVLK